MSGDTWGEVRFSTHRASYARGLAGLAGLKRILPEAHRVALWPGCRCWTCREVTA